MQARRKKTRREMDKIENPFYSSRERRELFPDAVFAAKQQKNKLAR